MGLLKKIFGTSDGKVACKKCGSKIIPIISFQNKGLCMPCHSEQKAELDLQQSQPQIIPIVSMDTCRKCGGMENLSFHRIHLIDILGSEHTESQQSSDSIIHNYNVRFRLGSTLGARICRSCVKKICAKKLVNYWLIAAASIGIIIVDSGFFGMRLIDGALAGVLLLALVFGLYYIFFGALYGVFILTPLLLFKEGTRKIVVDLWVKEDMRLKGNISADSTSDDFPYINYNPKVPLEPQEGVGYTDKERAELTTIFPKATI